MAGLLDQPSWSPEPSCNAISEAVGTGLRDASQALAGALQISSPRMQEDFIPFLKPFLGEAAPPPPARCNSSASTSWLSAFCSLAAEQDTTWVPARPVCKQGAALPHGLSNESIYSQMSKRA